MQLQLSITMLVSDRPSSVERCLDSLLPILQAIPSELIVVFTGKDQGVRERVLRYTDQVVDFEWCDDFSKARNAGLALAKGEWVMYLDDDEWFENPEEIVRFFQSGEYRDYNYGCYIQRNYSDWEGRGYLQSYVSRMSRRYPETRFIGKIHEYMYPRIEPVRFLPAWVHHYGYVDGTGVGASGAKKADRNIRLLRKEIQARRDLVRNYTQLAQEYACGRDYAESCDCAMKLLELVPPGWYGQEVSYVLANLPYWMAETGDKRQALETGERILRERKPQELCRLFLHMNLCQICADLKEYKALLRYAGEFKRLYEEIERKPEIWVSQEVLNVSETTVQANRYRCYLQGLDAAARVGGREEIRFFLEGLPWRDGKMEARFYQFLDDWKERFEDSQDVLGCLCGLEWDDCYIWLQKGLAAERDGDLPKVGDYYGRCVESGRWDALGGQVIRLALRCGLDMSRLLEGLDLDTWKAYARRISCQIPKSQVGAYLGYADVIPEEYGLYRRSYQNYLWERQLREQGLDDAKFGELLQTYCASVRSCYEGIYDPGVLERFPMSFFPQEYQFACWMEKGAKALDGRADLQEGMEAMGYAIRVYQHMIQAVRRLVGLLNRKLNENTALNSPEFLQLSVQVQNQVEALMEQGKYQEAYAAITQLCQLMPGNLEALKLKMRLYRYI